MNATSTDSLKSELDDLENVDDNAQDEDVSTSADLFTISSYGVDYNVDHLGRVDKLDSQSLANMIQDSFCGGYNGTFVNGRERMAVL